MKDAIEIYAECLLMPCCHYAIPSLAACGGAASAGLTVVGLSILSPVRAVKYRVNIGSTFPTAYPITVPKKVAVAALEMLTKPKSAAKARRKNPDVCIMAII